MKVAVVIVVFISSFSYLKLNAQGAVNIVSSEEKFELTLNGNPVEGEWNSVTISSEDSFSFNIEMVMERGKFKRSFELPKGEFFFMTQTTSRGKNKIRLRDHLELHSNHKNLVLKDYPKNHRYGTN